MKDETYPVIYLGAVFSNFYENICFVMFLLQVTIFSFGCVTIWTDILLKQRLCPEYYLTQNNAKAHE